MTLLVQTLILGLLIGGIYALMSSGFTLVFGVMKIINLAHAAMIVLAAFFTWWVWDLTGIDPLLLGVVATPVMYGFGWVLYKTVIARVHRADHELAMVASFAVAIAASGVMSLVWGTELRAATPSYFNTSLEIGSIVVPHAQLYACGGAVALLLGLYVLLRRTFIGRAIKACAENRDSAELVGINVERTMAQMFAIGAATTGFGGAALSVIYQFFPESHFVWIGRILCVVILGGLGSLAGAALGAAVLGVGETITAIYIDTQWATTVPYILIIAILVLRPQGLLGERMRADGAHA
ncbi:amino acid/amide ABC transporter membrane protein 1, HAAT family [Nocardioides sp. YR527]|uniref:branched-chain amino acid ABC transporter permease n=1 Tax=Nocardioides sp. YR527 TaxID=1881028 RepID=UPI00088619CE|nr:branched-chain amino acid ABC transporter permease [Nocardioides sp. YR527]SDK57110.1 amino acid/amide ABC transporter membrane protein 1, HAAT family [Nocardioides sp. YR527]